MSCESRELTSVNENNQGCIDSIVNLTEEQSKNCEKMDLRNRIISKLTKNLCKEYECNPEEGKQILACLNTLSFEEILLLEDIFLNNKNLTSDEEINSRFEALDTAVKAVLAKIVPICEIIMHNTSRDTINICLTYVSSHPELSKLEDKINAMPEALFMIFASQFINIIVARELLLALKSGKFAILLNQITDTIDLTVIDNYYEKLKNGEVLSKSDYEKLNKLVESLNLFLVQSKEFVLLAQDIMVRMIPLANIYKDGLTLESVVFDGMTAISYLATGATLLANGSKIFRSAFIMLKNKNKLRVLKASKAILAADSAITAWALAYNGYGGAEAFMNGNYLKAAFMFVTVYPLGKIFHGNLMDFGQLSRGIARRGFAVRKGSSVLTKRLGYELTEEVLTSPSFTKYVHGNENESDFKEKPKNPNEELRDRMYQSFIDRFGYTLTIKEEEDFLLLVDNINNEKDLTKVFARLNEFKKDPKAKAFDWLVEIALFDNDINKLKSLGLDENIIKELESIDKEITYKNS